MAVLRTLISLAAAAMLIQLSMAANYTVGGPNGGWDTGSNLQGWASSQSFSVGDNLIFQYTTNHDVLEVSKADYDSCQTSSPLQTHTDGNTVIPLTSPGKRYFICGTLGHCSQGMKVEIDTLATSSPPSASPATPPTSPVTPRSSPSPAESPKSVRTPPASPSESPSSSPSPSSDVPTTSPPPSGSSPQPPPSSATKSGFKTTLTVGISLGMLMLLAL